MEREPTRWSPPTRSIPVDPMQPCRSRIGRGITLRRGGENREGRRERRTSFRARVSRSSLHCQGGERNTRSHFAARIAGASTRARPSGRCFTRRPRTLASLLSLVNASASGELGRLAVGDGAEKPRDRRTKLHRRCARPREAASSSSVSSRPNGTKLTRRRIRSDRTLLAITPSNCDDGRMAGTKTRASYLFALRLACAVASASPWSCSRDGGETNGPARSEDCQQLMSAYCQRLAACDPVDLRRRYGDVATCTARQMPGCSFIILPGTAWTSAKVQQCVAQISATTDCYEEAFVAGACASEPGTLAEGTACQQGEQCASSHCVRRFVISADGSSSRPACGVCLRSDTGISTPPCGDGGACQSSERCVYADSEPSPRCIVPQPEGAPCLASAGCAGGLFCNRSVSDAGASICVKRGAAGAICTASTDCLKEDGLRCVSGVCAEPTFVSLGQACNQEDRLCEKDTRCPSPGLPPPNDMLTCQAAAEEGSPCHEILGPYCNYPANCIDGICHIERDAQCR
jgi:hypothetical protein